MKIGIFYGSSTGNTETAAELISENFSEHDCSVQDVSSIEPDDLLGYDFLILGISTWYVGEAQDDWIDLLEDMDGMDFRGVKFAVSRYFPRWNGYGLRKDDCWWRRSTGLHLYRGI